MIDRHIITEAVSERAKGVRIMAIAVRYRIPTCTLRNWLNRVRDCDGDIEAALVPRKIGRPRKTDDEEREARRKQRIAVAYAGHTNDLLTKLEITLRNWDSMLPEGRASVIKRTVEVFKDAPEELIKAIINGIDPAY